VIVDQLDVEFVEDVARAMANAIESVSLTADFRGGYAVDAVLGLAVAVASELGYDATTAFELGYDAILNVFLAD
jgi:hypothetical protein